PRRLAARSIPQPSHANTPQVPDNARRCATFRHGSLASSTARFGEEHAFPSEVWLSPNARDKPPSDPRGVVRITRKLYLKNWIGRDRAIEQKRQTEDHNDRGREPRSERGSACPYNQDPGGVSGMADEGVGSRGEDVLAAVGLEAND